MTYRLPRVRLASLSFLVMLAACIGNGTKNGDTTCLTVADAICAKDSACLGPGFYFASVAECATANANWCEAHLAVPGAGETSGSLASCASAYGAATCAELAANSGPSACTAPTGSLASGAVCQSSVACASGICTMTAGASCGVCAAAMSPGAPCDPTGSCTTGLVCNGSSVCAAPVALGGACSAIDVCGEGVCVGGKCSVPPLGGAGSPCDLGGPAWHDGCDVGQSLRCVPTTGYTGPGTCVEAPTAAPNAPCVSRAPGVPGTICTAGSICNGTICVPPLTLGETCGDANPTNYCGDDLVCTAGDAGSMTCQPYMPPVCK